MKGNAKIENTQKENTNLTCELSDVAEETKIELPYIYYLGYEITLNSNGEKINLKSYETENGFIGVELSEMERGVLQVSYKGSFLMKVSACISILGLIVLIMKIYNKEKE